MKNNRYTAPSREELKEIAASASNKLETEENTRQRTSRRRKTYQI